MTTSNMAVERLGAEYFQDPDSVHARLRARGPLASVIMPGGTPAWLVTGYADAVGNGAVTSPNPCRLRPGSADLGFTGSLDGAVDGRSAD